jgi:hypothetical protein
MTERLVRLEVREVPVAGSSLALALNLNRHEFSVPIADKESSDD